MSTNKGFLEMLVNMSWVILQDCKLLIGKYKRCHLMFDTFPEIFRSDLFKYFAIKLMKNIDEAEDPNDAKVDVTLPWILVNVDAQTREIKKLCEDISRQGEENQLVEVN